MIKIEWLDENQRTKRLLVTIPTYLIAWAAVTLSSPAWVLAALVVGVIRRRSFVLLRLLLYLWAYLTLALIGIVRWSLLRMSSHHDLRERTARLSAWYGTSLVRWCGRLLSLSFQVEGSDELSGPLLVFVRHVSIVDAALPVAVLEPWRIPVRYVLRRELVLEPYIDLASSTGPHCLLDRDGPPRREIERIRHSAEDLGDEAVVIFPEGTRFSEAKREREVARLKGSRPDVAPLADSMTHVLPPRLAGSLALLRAAPEADCLFVAHRGLEGLATPTDFLRGDAVGRQIHIKLIHVSRACVPAEDEQARWLYERWREVDDFARGSAAADSSIR